MAFSLFIWYSKNCLIQHLCNPFHCVFRCWFPFPFDHFHWFFCTVESDDTLSFLTQNIRLDSFPCNQWDLTQYSNLFYLNQEWCWCINRYFLSVICWQDADNIPLRVMLLLMDEVFDLREKNTWLRRRIVAVLKQLIKVTFGDSINKKIVDYVDFMTSAEQMAEYVRKFK